VLAPAWPVLPGQTTSVESAGDNRRVLGQGKHGDRGFRFACYREPPRRRGGRLPGLRTSACSLPECVVTLRASPVSLSLDRPKALVEAALLCGFPVAPSDGPGSRRFEVIERKLSGSCRLIEAASQDRGRPRVRITIWFAPCLRISGSADAELVDALAQMIEPSGRAPRSRTSGFRRLGLQPTRGHPADRARASPSCESAIRNAERSPLPPGRRTDEARRDQECERRFVIRGRASKLRLSHFQPGLALWVILLRAPPPRPLGGRAEPGRRAPISTPSNFLVELAYIATDTAAPGDHLVRRRCNRVLHLASARLPRRCGRSTTTTAARTAPRSRSGSRSHVSSLAAAPRR